VDYRDVPADRIGHHTRSAAAPATQVAVPHGDKNIGLIEQDLAHGFVGGLGFFAIAIELEHGGAALEQRLVGGAAVIASEVLGVFGARKRQAGFNAVALLQRKRGGKGVSAVGQGSYQAQLQGCRCERGCVLACRLRGSLAQQSQLCRNGCFDARPVLGGQFVAAVARNAHRQAASGFQFRLRALAGVLRAHFSHTRPLTGWASHAGISSGGNGCETR
jgi:hypothetical protein